MRASSACFYVKIFREREHTSGGGSESTFVLLVACDGAAARRKGGEDPKTEEKDGFSAARGRHRRRRYIWTASSRTLGKGHASVGPSVRDGAGRWLLGDTRPRVSSHPVELVATLFASGG